MKTLCMVLALVTMLCVPWLVVGLFVAIWSSAALGFQIFFTAALVMVLSCAIGVPMHQYLKKQDALQ